MITWRHFYMYLMRYLDYRLGRAFITLAFVSLIEMTYIKK